MRVIVSGQGEIGGVVAASLAKAGTNVICFARGRMPEAARAAGGLTLTSRQGEEKIPLPCVAGPDEVDWRPGRFRSPNSSAS